MVSNFAVTELTGNCNIVSIIINFGTRKAAMSNGDAQDEEKNGCCHRRFHCGSAVAFGCNIYLGLTSYLEEDNSKC